jgi:hypothetical protein
MHFIFWNSRARFADNRWSRPTAADGLWMARAARLLPRRLAPGVRRVPEMKRREFTMMMGAVAAGLASGSKVRADEKPQDKADKHTCKGHNSCQGKGGCKTGDNGCAGRNSCKGKGGCASAEARHSCKGQNSCKGLGGCKTSENSCAGKNSCKGKGGCAVPPAEKKDSKNPK